MTTTLLTGLVMAEGAAAQPQISRRQNRCSPVVVNR